MRAIGYVSLMIGTMWLLYVFNMDTSVPIGLTGQRIQNLSLMERRQTHLILAIVTVLVGALLLVVASLRGGLALDDIESVQDDDYRSCPHCAEPIRLAAVLCRHCRSAVEAMHEDNTDDDDAVMLEPGQDCSVEDNQKYSYRVLAKAAEEAERSMT
jgi:hypothetical protein